MTVDGSQSARSGIDSVRRLRAALGASAAVIASSTPSAVFIDLVQEITFARQLIEATQPDVESVNGHMRDLWRELRSINLATAARLPDSEQSFAILRDQLAIDRGAIQGEK